MKKKLICLAVVLLAVILAIIYIHRENNNLIITEFTVKSNKIPPEFDGFKIVHISDLHNKRFGDGQSRLLGMIEEQTPDIIAVTGDLIDKRTTDIDIAMEFIDGAVKIAPVYYVTGNHESQSGKYDELSEKLVAAGIIDMNDAFTDIEKGQSAISVIGVFDMAFNGKISLDETVKGHSEKIGNFKILLSHRPELMEMYKQNGIDLVLSGHAHGGQVRLPFVGALVAPNQGLFPKYSKGVYNEDGTCMIVSGGLGNSLLPLRMLNPPEIVIITLESGVE